MDYEFSTPMMKQYEKIKKEHTDCLLFYRLGDFYEMFLEDAKTASKVLDITLTSRSRGKDGRIPMAGVPYHAVDAYLNKLVKAGYKVAICEQMSEPNKKGIVEREVVRIVTPGTVIDEKALESKIHNFLAAIHIQESVVSISWADISTGTFFVLERFSDNPIDTLRQLLESIQPTECIVSEYLYTRADIIALLRQELNLNVTWFQQWDMHVFEAEKKVKKHFRTRYLESIGLTNKKTAIECISVLLSYLEQTQKQQIQHIRNITYLDEQEYMILDTSTVLNLELFSTLREHTHDASLLKTLDMTETAMGGRLLRQWITKPLRDKTHIEQRYDCVDTLIADYTLRSEIESLLTDIYDIERILSRLSLGTGNARDLLHLALSLSAVVTIQKTLESISDTHHAFTNIVQTIDRELSSIIQTITATIVEQPPVSIRDGNMIRQGVDTALDTLRTLTHGGKEWLESLEREEKKRTGINSLKVRFNKVFGFYIEVSHANTHLVPDNYIRKQTLVNGERYITPELKEYEIKILSAEEEMKEKEYHIFQTLLFNTLKYTEHIQRAAKAIAEIDCFLSFAKTAIEYRYTRPKLTDTQTIQIKGGRHPVVERLLHEQQFVPNDIHLTDKQKLLIITGPNMAGKSVLIRQVAIIALMAQIGSFVPAAKAELPIIDRLFVRSGASDAITAGMSTFMVEMVETAYILKHATPKSLIIMDEIGRGTSTYDGISLAWAVAEFLVTEEHKRANTLFATHYHELQDLEHSYPEHIKNYHMAVIQENDIPVFLHTLQEGGASASFGIAVGTLAGLPANVLTNAQTLLTKLESHHLTQKKNTKEQTPNSELLTLIQQLDINTMTPIEALNLLERLKKKYQLYSV